MSFQFKLLLAMIGLVTVVLGATLFITQQKVLAAYHKLAQDQFETEVNYFTKLQETRLDSVKKHSEELADNADLQKALAAGNISEAYRVGADVLAHMPEFGGTRRSRPGPAKGSAELDIPPNWFFRILDAEGNILHPVLLGDERRRLESQLKTVKQGMKKLETQKVGFLEVPERNRGKPRSWELVVTKIPDPANQQAIGAIVLGQAMFDQSDTFLNDLNHIKAGIWLEGQIYSRTIPASQFGELGALLTKEIKPGLLQETLTDNSGRTPRQVHYKLLNPDSPFPPAYHVSVISLAGAVKAQEELRWEVLSFGAVSILVAFLMSLGVSHGLFLPLRELVAGTRAIRAGDFQVKVPVRSRDEIGELAASFNEMVVGLEQKEQYRTVLNLVADEAVAHSLINGRLKAGGELKEITILFCDIREFTTLTAAMPPEEVFKMLNEHMTALARLVKEHHGVVDKFVGDMVMAIFGAPVSHETDTLNAVRCAQAMIRERIVLNATSKHQLTVGVGIATGQMLAGCMGSSDRLSYTVLGERVNLASRLCDEARPSQILIDQSTVDQVGSEITIQRLPALKLKGFPDSLPVYEVKPAL